jgi:hypothetical protein
VGNRIGVYHQGEGMVCQPLRLALLIGAITAVAVSPVRAHHRSAPCCNPCSSGVGAGVAATAPAYRTITTTECVPETYTVKRTCYRVECRTETYQTCRTECVPVCRERVCTVIDRVPCMETVTRKVCKHVTTYEDRTVMKPCYSYVQETCMRKELVCRGHWECREVPTLLGRLGHGHGNDCCDPCGGSSCCVPTRTKKVWVSCPEYRECPVTVCKKVCTMVPTTCRVAVCRPVWSDVTCQVCTYKCVSRQVTQKYTCYETRSVPCTATRTVRVCVPYETDVTCTRWVARQVCRQVPCAPVCDNACSTSCNDACNDSCCNPCCGKPRKFGGLFNRSRCNSGCCR